MFFRATQKEIWTPPIMSKSHKGNPREFETINEQSSSSFGSVARVAPRWRVTRIHVLSGVLIVAIAAIALFGCSSSKSEESDSHAANHSIARLSPEQCAAGAQIQAAGDLSGPEGSYLIQP